MTRFLIVFVVACVPPQQGYAPSYQAQAQPGAEIEDDAPRSIQINGKAVGPVQLEIIASLEATYNARLPDGAYWYDRVNGAFGVWGQPGLAVLPAGLDLGPPLPRNASHGSSRVFVNGRELQHVEVQFLSALVGVPWQRGRYFIDAVGNAGLEGGEVLVNLVQVAQQRGQAAAANNGGQRGREVHSTTGFGENQSWFYSDGTCRHFMTAKGDTISSGC